MPHRTLAELEQTLQGSTSGQIIEPPADAVARCQELAAAYHSRKHQQTPEDRPLRAYLLLDRWDGSAVAAELAEVWPEAAEARAAVPDAFYAGREGEAPCVVPLPEIALPDGGTSTLAQARAQEILAEWLQAASRQAHKRLAPQDLCAVLFSTDSAGWVAQHLAKLGFQYPPGSTSARVFRYQDPRVMQRVWPELGAAQQSMWHGPIQTWWSLIQPWGPWALEELLASEALAVPVPEWFKAEQTIEPDGQTKSLVLNRLMDAEQWQVAHSTPNGNRVWARFAEAGVSMDGQPDADLMQHLLAVGTSHQLDEANLEDFVWCSIRYRETPPSIDWHAPHWSRVLSQTLKALNADHDARFVSAFDVCLNLGEKTHGVHQPV